MGEVVDGAVSEVRRRIGRLLPRALLRHRSAAARDGQAPVGRPAEAAAARRPRSGQGFNAYKAAVETKGQPTVVLARTIKGYGLGEAGEGKNITHQQKKMNEADLRTFRTRFGIPISDEQIAEAPFYRPADDSPELRIPARAPQGAGRLRARRAPVRVEAAAGRRSTTSSRSSTRAPRGARRRRRWCSCGCCRSCCATRKSASSSCRSCRTRRARSAWKRCSAPSASTPTSASATSRSTWTRSCITRKRRTGRFSKRASPKPDRCRRSSPPAPRTRRTASTRFRSSSTTRCSASSASAI